MNALEAQTSESPQLTEALQLGCGLQEIVNQIHQQQRTNNYLYNEIDYLAVQLARERRRLTKAPQKDYAADLEYLYTDIYRAEKRILLYENEIARRWEACNEQTLAHARDESVTRLLAYRDNVLYMVEYQNEHIAIDMTAAEAAIDSLRQYYIKVRQYTG